MYLKVIKHQCAYKVLVQSVDQSKVGYVQHRKIEIINEGIHIISAVLRRPTVLNVNMITKNMEGASAEKSRAFVSVRLSMSGCGHFLETVRTTAPATGREVSNQYKSK